MSFRQIYSFAWSLTGFLWFLFTITTMPSSTSAQESDNIDVPPLPTGPRLRTIGTNIPRIVSRNGAASLTLAEPLAIGIATHTNFHQEPAYQTVAAREYDVITPENDMKMGPLVPNQRGSYDFTAADEHVRFAEAHGMQVHGHTLVWHQQLPDWLQPSLSPAELRSVLQEHIRTVVSHYGDRVAVWDVVNEAIADSPVLFFGSPMRSTIWSRAIPDYVDLAFFTAREANPSAILLLNDYSVEEVNSKSNRMYNLVAGMVRRGVPIDGVGFQGHLRANGLNYCSMANNMQRFADLGLDIYITELDVRLSLGRNGDISPFQSQRQADIYRNVMRVCLEQPACKSVQTWGMTDLHSWIPSFAPGFGSALPFDENLAAKPAYYAMQSAMLEQRTPDDVCAGQDDSMNFLESLFGGIASFFF